MPSQMFPMLCGVDGCEARLVETIHPGVFVCLAEHGDGTERPVFEYPTDDQIIKGTGRKMSYRAVLFVGTDEGAEDGAV